MAGIDRVFITDLFWSTLGDLRGTPAYESVREAIHDLVARKAEGSGPVNGRDKPFSRVPALHGVWHVAVRRNPDIVLFYVPRGNEIVLAMMGSHHDFPSDGKNFAAAARTGTRIRNAAAGEHSPSPNWPTLAWKAPGEIVDHPELRELSPRALERLQEELVAEMEEGAAFERWHGENRGSADADDLGTWLDDCQRALDSVNAAYRAKPLSCEAHLEAAKAAPFRR